MHITTERLYQAVAELHRIHTPADLAPALKVSHQTLRNWEQKGISKKGMQEVRLALGISPEWLATGQGEMRDAPAPIAPTSPIATPALPDQTAYALRKLALSADNIHTEMVQNDNMANTLDLGDTVLIDPNIREYIGSGIYVLDSPSGHLIYRIKAFANGMMMLINDNPAYPPELIRPEERDTLKIIGRVVGKYGIVAL